MSIACQECGSALHPYELVFEDGNVDGWYCAECQVVAWYDEDGNYCEMEVRVKAINTRETEHGEEVDLVTTIDLEEAVDAILDKAFVKEALERTAP